MNYFIRYILSAALITLIHLPIETSSASKASLHKSPLGQALETYTKFKANFTNFKASPYLSGAQKKYFTRHLKGVTKADFPVANLQNKSIVFTSKSKPTQTVTLAVSDLSKGAFTVNGHNMIVSPKTSIKSQMGSIKFILNKKKQGASLFNLLIEPAEALEPVTVTLIAGAIIFVIDQSRRIYIDSNFYFKDKRRSDEKIFDLITKLKSFAKIDKSVSAAVTLECDGDDFTRLALGPLESSGVGSEMNEKFVLSVDSISKITGQPVPDTAKVTHVQFEGKLPGSLQVVRLIDSTKPIVKDSVYEYPLKYAFIDDGDAYRMFKQNNQRVDYKVEPDGLTQVYDMKSHDLNDVQDAYDYTSLFTSSTKRFNECCASRTYKNTLEDLVKLSESEREQAFKESKKSFTSLAGAIDNLKKAKLSTPAVDAVK